MTWALLLLFCGLFLSAFFSGSETGFYRVPRVRLVLDALSGDRVAKWLWEITIRPTLFVATVLVGNNLANYLTSLAIVIGAGQLHLGGHLVELFATLLFAPVIFVYGELLPKNLFYQSPYRLLHASGPLFLLFAALFSPISLMLWTLSRVLQFFSGESHQQVQLLLARRELESVFEEGHEAGILRPAQRQLAQGLFAVASERVANFAQPRKRVVHARTDMTKSEVLRLARRHKLAELPVEQSGGKRELVGYVRVADLRLSDGDDLQPLRVLPEVSESEPYIAALVRLHNAGESMARVVGQGGKTQGLINSRALSKPLFRAES